MNLPEDFVLIKLAAHCAFEIQCCWKSLIEVVHKWLQNMHTVWWRSDWKRQTDRQSNEQTTKANAKIGKRVTADGPYNERIENHNANDGSQRTTKFQVNRWTITSFLFRFDEVRFETGEARLEGIVGQRNALFRKKTNSQIKSHLSKCVFHLLFANRKISK